jgi:hypothetical protein
MVLVFFTGHNTNVLLREYEQYQQATTLQNQQARQCTYKTKTRSRNPCCSGKEISITHSECMSTDLDIQNAMSMRRITPSSVACPALQYFFFTLSHKRHDFRKIIYLT